MCFVEYDKRVRTEKAGMVGTHLPRYAVAFEEQARPDHVHRSDDNRGRGRILQPFAVVDVPAAERGAGSE